MERGTREPLLLYCTMITNPRLSASCIYLSLQWSHVNIDKVNVEHALQFVIRNYRMSAVVKVVRTLFSSDLYET